MPLTLPRRPNRLAVMGVGNDMKGDDGAGAVAARRLAVRLGHRADVLVIDAGVAPENFTGKLRPFAPDLVVELDAAILDGPPGECRWLDWRDTDGLSASTHTLPPSIVGRFLTTDLGCEMAVIGIQPAALEFGAPLSPEVDEAVDRLVGDLVRWIEG